MKKNEPILQKSARELKTDGSVLTLSDDESGGEIDVEIEMLFTSRLMNNQTTTYLKAVRKN